LNSIPGCNEVVTWIVAKKALHVDTEDLMKFRTLKVGGKPITRNWRPEQPMGTAPKRKVYSVKKSWKKGKKLC